MGQVLNALASVIVAAMLAGMVYLLATSHQRELKLPKECNMPREGQTLILRIAQRNGERATSCRMER